MVRYRSTKGVRYPWLGCSECLVGRWSVGCRSVLDVVGRWSFVGCRWFSLLYVGVGVGYVRIDEIGPCTLDSEQVYSQSDSSLYGVVQLGHTVPGALIVDNCTDWSVGSHWPTVYDGLHSGWSMFASVACTSVHQAVAA